MFQVGESILKFSCGSAVARKLYIVNIYASCKVNSCKDAFANNPKHYAKTIRYCVDEVHADKIRTGGERLEKL